MFVETEQWLGPLVRNSTYTRKNLTTCSKSANKPSTSCVRMACYKLSTNLEQAVNIIQFKYVLKQDFSRGF